MKIKNITPFIFLMILCQACDKYNIFENEKLKEKVIVTEHISLINYIPKKEIISNNGFLISVETLLTNGDSSKCDIVYGVTTRIYNIDLASYQVQKLNGVSQFSFIDIINEGENSFILTDKKISKYNKLLTEVETIDLNFSSIPNVINLKGFSKINDEKFILFGTTNEFEIFIKYDKKLGVEKYIFGKKKIVYFTGQKYTIENDKLIGILIDNYYNSSPRYSKITTNKYDLNLNLLESVEIENQDLFNPYEIVYKNNQFNIITSINSIININLSNNSKINTIKASGGIVKSSKNELFTYASQNNIGSISKLDQNYKENKIAEIKDLKGLKFITYELEEPVFYNIEYKPNSKSYNLIKYIKNEKVFDKVILQNTYTRKCN